LSSDRKDNSGQQPWKKWVKYFTHRKNRRATKEKLDHEKYDDIPQDKPVKEEDPWGWD
jgi:ribosomal protein L33